MGSDSIELQPAFGIVPVITDPLICKGLHLWPACPRYALPGQPQHVIQRGNNRSPTFFANDDYRFYLQCLKEATERHDCAVHAYVLMTNHVHLLLTPATPTAISKVLQSVGRRYRTGTLWEGRFRAAIIDSEHYLLTCYRYIELNPVRAGMVAQPADYPWSSYRTHAHGMNDPLVSDHALYTALGKTATERQQAYRALFSVHLDKAMLSTIRDATNKAWALGNNKFKSAIEATLQRRASPLPRGGVRKRSQL